MDCTFKTFYYCVCEYMTCICVDICHSRHWEVKSTLWSWLPFHLYRSQISYKQLYPLSRPAGPHGMCIQKERDNKHGKW